MPENFICLTDGVNVAPLVNELKACEYLWSQITGRQDTAGSPHTYTETIFLRWCHSREVSAVFTAIEAVDYPAYRELPEARTLVEFIQDQIPSDDLGRVIITRLKATSMIAPHMDTGDYADHYERFHLPLVSEPGNNFYSDVTERQGEFVHMLPGEIWWFNHKRPHYYYNGSASPRIHLIVDCVAPAYRRERDIIEVMPDAA